MENTRFEKEQNLRNTIKPGTIAIFCGRAYTAAMEDQKKAIYYIDLVEYLTAWIEIKGTPAYLADPTNENYISLMHAYIMEISENTKVLAIL